ncbi:hypothetical protein QFC19_001893 [Naganishia cerealis]|uniref:Uncharacterized protein n=1 Tax=Naganishia cerealis TaxID=610337 RepID=A0ACC2WDT6_9TREE|nr:hypothetical protein QFC19_001893 [Naganishia cerealis]
MGFFDHDDSDERQAYEQVEREGSTSHEVVAGAASFLAMRKYMQKQESEGKPESYETAKEIIAAIAGAEADKLIETKGLSAVDRMKAKHQAEENAKRALAQSGQFGDSRYEPQGFEQSRYGGGGGGYGGGGGSGNQGYGGGRQEEYGRGGQGGFGGGNQGGFDGRGGFPGDQEMRGGRMEGQGYGGGPDYQGGRYVETHLMSTTEAAMKVKEVSEVKATSMAITVVSSGVREVPRVVAEDLKASGETVLVDMKSRVNTEEKVDTKAEVATREVGVIKQSLPEVT